MKLVVDVNLDSEVLFTSSSQQNAIALLLSKSTLVYEDMPLEAALCRDFGLTPDQDYPIAAISAHVDGINVKDNVWFRVDPIHLVMQRDALVLSAPVPLKLYAQESDALLALLNAHFKSDGLEFVVGWSGAWYLRLDASFKHLAVATVLPHVAIDKNVQHFFPKGDAADYWIGMQNEIQMLLFDHAVNQVREAKKMRVINSLWFSGGGAMPATARDAAPQNCSIVASNPLYEGLAKFSNMNFAKTDHVRSISAFTSLINHANQDIRFCLMQDAFLMDWLVTFQNFLQSRKITQLVLNVGWYEQTISASLHPRDLKKFWRKLKPLNYFLK